jgi:hypothetical protein
MIVKNTVSVLPSLHHEEIYQPQPWPNPLLLRLEPPLPPELDPTLPDPPLPPLL